MSNKVRFKILLALFNSNFTVNNKRLGLHSHSFSELRNIIGVKAPDLEYHLKILSDVRLVEKSSKPRGYYHITKDGKGILKMFGVNPELVRSASKNM